MFLDEKEESYLSEEESTNQNQVNEDEGAFFTSPDLDYNPHPFEENINYETQEYINDLDSNQEETEIDNYQEDDNAQIIVNDNLSSIQPSDQDNLFDNKIEETLPKTEEFEEKTEANKTTSQPRSTIIQNLNNPIIESIQSALNTRVKYQFKKKVLENYHNQCAITGCKILPLLEVVMINPAAERMQDHPCNGLVLRRDLSVLFDLYLLGINPYDLTILVSPMVKNDEYQALNGQKLLIEDTEAIKPKTDFLISHLKNCSWYQLNLSELAKKDHENKLLLAQNVKKNNSFSLQKLPTYLTTKKEQPRWVNIGLGTITFISLLGLIVLNALYSNKKPNVISGDTSLNNLDIEIGDLVYQNNGLIDNNNSFISLTVLTHLGVNTNNIKPEGDIIKFDVSSPLKTQSIDLKIKGNTYEKQGLIIEITSISYIPISLVKDLNIQESSIAENQTIKYKNISYVKASELKNLGIKLTWDAQTRTLSLDN
jgi:hypothetical protein